MNVVITVLKHYNKEKNHKSLCLIVIQTEAAKYLHATIKYLENI